MNFFENNENNENNEYVPSCKCAMKGTNCYKFTHKNRFFCKCEAKNINCNKGICPTFTQEGIADDIENFDFNALYYWEEDNLDQFALNLYDEPEFGKDFLPKLTIHNFYNGFNHYVDSYEQCCTQRKELIKKFKYIERALTRILKERIGQSDKNQVTITIPRVITGENIEYIIDFREGVITHRNTSGRYSTKYGEDVKCLEYFFTDDSSIRVSTGKNTSFVQVRRVLTPIHTFSLMDKYMGTDDEELESVGITYLLR